MRIAPTVAAAALAVATLASPAAASPNDVTAAERCGFYVQAFSALYNHCAPDGTHVEIVVKRKTGEQTRCVGPGVTFLGTSAAVLNAWYNGKLC